MMSSVMKRMISQKLPWIPSSSLPDYSRVSLKMGKISIFSAICLVIIEYFLICEKFDLTSMHFTVNRHLTMITSKCQHSKAINCNLWTSPMKGWKSKIIFEENQQSFGQTSNVVHTNEIWWLEIDQLLTRFLTRKTSQSKFLFIGNFDIFFEIFF